MLGIEMGRNNVQALVVGWGPRVPFHYPFYRSHLRVSGASLQLDNPHGDKLPQMQKPA